MLQGVGDHGLTNRTVVYSLQQFCCTPMLTKLLLSSVFYLSLSHYMAVDVACCVIIYFENGLSL